MYTIAQRLRHLICHARLHSAFCHMTKVTAMTVCNSNLELFQCSLILLCLNVLCHLSESRLHAQWR